MKEKQIGMTAFFLLTAAFFLFSGAVKQESAKQLFEKAVHLEETKGDLEKAIEVYKRIVAEFPEERALAAQSLYRSGLCSERLGRRDAEKAFQKIIEVYPDQTATVKLAREKLAALAGHQKGDQEFKITKIHSDKLRSGYLSPDGKTLALVDSKENNIWLRDIASGREVHLVRPAHEILDCFWSWDSRWITFFSGSSVGIISAEGGQPRTIIELDPETSEPGEYIYPMGWTSDSRKLIFQDSAKGLFAVPISGGKWEEIHRFPDPQKAKEQREWLTLSPDGKSIAYQSTQEGNQDIYVMPARGGEPVRITDDPANDSWPQWSYDGRWLAFSSTRGGDSGLWVVKINPDGTPGSRPIQVVQGTRGGVWTRDGRIAYSTRTYVEHIFTANTDGSQEVQLTKINKWNAAPRWSPDSKTIAFIADYGTEMGRSAIWTVPAQGGDEKLLTPGWAPVWSPDGKKIAFCGERRSAKATISIIPAEGGEAKELINYDGSLMALDWSPDGRQIAFSYSRRKDAKNPIPDSPQDGTDIYMISVADGQVKRLTRVGRGDGGKKDFSSSRWSPDGKKIVFRSLDYERYEKGESDAIGIYTMDVEGGEPKLITNEFDGWWFCWSLDGKSIISS
ncbi:MAG: tetratricopeptide repeat protein, partial [Candidatus Aminicenantes bacterium]|nr:tetratricopeptide repeat protein [Candidatus Aminicenantes bacterium]